MTQYTAITGITIFIVGMLGTACDRTSPEHDKDHAAHEGSHEDSKEAEHSNDIKSEDEHDHGEEASDLDRPVTELFDASCEHNMKTFLCDECRYEVGVVKVPEELFKGKLISTTRCEKRKIEVPVRLTGEVRFDERRVGHVNTQVEGVVKRVFIALGERVKTGQGLIELESVAVGDDQAAWHEAQGLLSLARQNFARAEQLRKENISSEKEFLQARQDLEAAEIRAEGARNRLKRLGTGSTAGGRLTLRAPMDGTVLSMHAVPGEVARTGESLVTVGDNRVSWVWADLYERDLAAVFTAQQKQTLAAQISVKAYPGQTFPGTVDLISPSMDELSRTVKIRIEVNNADGRLLSGMFATVDVFLPGDEDTLSVPKDAVLEDEGRTFVFVHHHDEFYVRRPVETGRRWAGWVEIKGGLSPLQTVIADGAFLLKSDVLRSKMGAGCAD